MLSRSAGWQPAGSPTGSRPGVRSGWAGGLPIRDTADRLSALLGLRRQPRQGSLSFFRPRAAAITERHVMNADKIPQEHATKWFVCLALAVVTFAAYVPVLRNGFINLDDPDYVTQNPFVQQGYSWDAVKWAFSAFHTCNWHPLTWLSHMLDCQLYGLDPAGHHLTSLAFHVANTLLLFLLLGNLTARMWPGAFVALLFGLHPMHVESVAWVAERKDVLSAFFFMLTLLCYAKAVRGDPPSQRFSAAGDEPVTSTAAARSPVVSQVTCHRSRFYWLALLLFALGLMAKPMLVTLPCLLCLLDYWPLGRFQFPLRSQSISIFRLLALEKIPFFVLTAAFCGITFIAQYQSSVQPRRSSGGGAIGPYTRGLRLVCAQVVLAGQPLHFLSAAPFPAPRSRWGFGPDRHPDVAGLPPAS